jgi:cytochrome c-type biogenesis protein CcmH
MIFWLLAIATTVVACAALYYAAAGRRVNAGAAVPEAAGMAHFRLQLGEIEAAAAGGRLPAAEAIAARAELARELLRQQREAGRQSAGWPVPPLLLPIATVCVAVIAFAAYAGLGRPDLPSQPFADRPGAADTMSLEAAVKTVETRLATHPDDLRGWQVIAPIYMRSGRYADAEHAFRRILELAPPTADAETDLAEALMMENGGAATGEAAELLTKAAALDPHHVRSRFYLAAESMRSKDYPAAVAQWSALVALEKGDEPWMATAKAGLAAAEAGRDGKPMPAADAGAAQSPAIQQMVAGLATRLAASGGTLAEWTRLVRSEIVLGDLAKAQSAYDAARKAYPDAADRAELDTLAAQAGLKLDGSTP